MADEKEPSPAGLVKLLEKTSFFIPLHCRARIAGACGTGTSSIANVSNRYIITNQSQKHGAFESICYHFPSIIAT